MKIIGKILDFAMLNCLSLTHQTTTKKTKTMKTQIIITKVNISTGSVWTNLGFFTFKQWEILSDRIFAAMQGKFRNQFATFLPDTKKAGFILYDIDPKYYQTIK